MSCRRCFAVDGSHVFSASSSSSTSRSASASEESSACSISSGECFSEVSSTCAASVGEKRRSILADREIRSRGRRTTGGRAMGNGFHKVRKLLPSNLTADSFALGNAMDDEIGTYVPAPVPRFDENEE